jgi:hypothetical protein
MAVKTHKTIRCKARCGLSCKWVLDRTKDGQFKAISLGGAKRGRDPVPTAFIPFELSSAVIGGPSFPTMDEAERHVRSL